ncbi:MAG TPA: hypothetical protein VNG33_23130, partial [Polyangiaceae bacterium]|nr:hypothetical protein [Polyangiaceae bacterium]
MCSVAVRSRHRLSAFMLLASTLLLTSACGAHYISHGTALYDDGHYVEAAEVFEKTEQRLASSSSSERARFGLYRGATFLKLGDVQHAARWLGYARGIVKNDPDALDRDETALLGASLKVLGNAGPSAPERSHSEVATAPSPGLSDA